MNKILRYSLLAVLAMMCNVSFAQTEFDFDNNAATLLGIAGESSNESHDGDITEAKTATVGEFSVTVSAAAEGVKNANRIWNSAPKLRMYSGTLTVSSTGTAIKTIVFTLATNASKAKWGAENSASVGTIDASAGTTVTWTGDASEVVFTIAANTQISKITINGGATPGPTPTPSGDLTGAGTLENPYTVADALIVTGKLSADEKSATPYYIKGKVSSIKYTFSAQYGTATFNISDNGEAANEFTCYGVYHLENKAWVDGNTQIAVGDDVIVYGTVINYKGTTPETANKEAYIYSLNGKTKEGDTPTPTPSGDLTGAGTLESPYTVADALIVTGKLGADEKSATPYYIKGKVSSIKYTFSAQYGTATFNISDNGEAANEFTCYAVYHLENKAWVDGNTQIAVGDDVIVYGTVINYKGTTLETASKEAYIYSLNGKTKEENTPGPTPVTVEEITVAKALELINALADGGKTDKEYKVKGYIVGTPDFKRNKEGALYGDVNAAIADEKGGATTLTIYRAKSFSNEVFTEETISLLKEGDEVVFQGTLQKYVKNEQMTPELVSGYLISVNGQITGIETIKANQTAGKMYNLAGQVVNKGYKGMVIINGRKFMNK